MTTFQDEQLREITNQFHDDWVVPEFRIDFWGERTSDYCVVVPVINEGNRIQQFVRRLKESCISSIVDIIIVDGGSTDNSLEHNYLMEHGVRGLLTKTGKGGLSAQLRIAYSFALSCNYSGVITIDGNNKDDPADISLLLKALLGGFDFVQASRFKASGRQINTPLVRYFAIRFIHAPILSFFSGFSWTDTTQGFRGYSKRLLTDPRISLFRSVFDSYELLVFLSYIAPRLGFKCIEVGTTRIYPQGLVPTKISSIRGNLKILGCLLSAVTNIYTP